MNLITYWDLDDKARAALSESDVTRYLDAELMVKGCLRVVPPEFEEVPPEPELPKRTYYCCANLLFETAEQAAALAAMKPRLRQTKYLGGGYRNSVGYAGDIGTEITIEKLVDENTIVLASAQLDKRAAILDANERKRDAYEKASKEMSKVLDGVWDDWHRCRDRSAQLRRVIETFENYVRTAGGNRDVASAFLAKVFDAETIKDACEWHGVEIPTSTTKLEPGPSHPEVAPQPVTDGIPF